MKHQLEKTVKAGGSTLSSQASRQIFKGDARRARNTVLACAEPAIAAAVRAEVIRDHRVVPVLLDMGGIAARVVAQLESRLGRRLSRDRAYALRSAYAAVRSSQKHRAQVIPLWLKKPEQAPVQAIPAFLLKAA